MSKFFSFLKSFFPSKVPRIPDVEQCLPRAPSSSPQEIKSPASCALASKKPEETAGCGTGQSTPAASESGAAAPPSSVPPNSMASLASRIISAKPHVPLIKFRYRKDIAEAGKQVSGMAYPSAGKESSSKSAPSRTTLRLSSTSAASEELPARFRRKPMTDDEIFAINTGGVKRPVEEPATKKKPK